MAGGISIPRLATWPRRRGFSLIELLAVIGIIALVVTFAIPAYRFIMGTRSVGAAENLVGAMLSQARAYAIANQRYAGVAFYLDPASGRTTMAIVIEKLPGSDPGEDPYLSYKGWALASTSGRAPNSYVQGQEVIAAQADYEEGKTVVRRFYALQDHQASNRARPELRAPTGENAFWAWPSSSIYIDLLPDALTQALPAGVACQLVNDQDPAAQVAGDRYVRTGVILFDPKGTLVCQRIIIDRRGQLGSLLLSGGSGAAVVAAIPADPRVRFRSQLGVVLYESEDFESRGFTDADSMFEVGYLNPPRAANRQKENEEEKWLDQYGRLILIGRHDGTLLRGDE